MIWYKTISTPTSGQLPTSKQLKTLFDSVSWAQTLTKEELKYAIDNSSHIITAWDNDNLVGLIRSMDDNIYSASIDLLLVKKEYQGQGIGTALIEKMKENIKHIKFISVSPDNIKDFKLYQRCGFVFVNNSGQLQLHN